MPTTDASEEHLADRVSQSPARIGKTASVALIFPDATSEATEIVAECVSTEPARAAATIMPVSPNHARATIESAKAAIRGAEAKLGDARLQMTYATIRAPISGRAGAILRKAGLVAANNEVLVTINQVTPVYATFSVPEQSIPDLRRYSAGGKLKVQAIPQNAGPEAAANGVLDFLDNRVDASTGTIMLKARSPNQDRKLWPGQFVNVNVQLAMTNEIVAPTAAVKTAQQGNYVFVVKPDMTAEQRTVLTARSYEDITVIQNGLNPGERVIVEGQVRVKNGSKVRISGGGGPGERQPRGPRTNGGSTEKAALER